MATGPITHLLLLSALFSGEVSTWEPENLLPRPIWTWVFFYYILVPIFMKSSEGGYWLRAKLSGLQGPEKPAKETK